MNVIKLTVLLAIAAALAGCAAGTASAPADEEGAELSARLAGATFGRVPGPPVSCVEVSQLSANRALGRSLLLFEGVGGRLYANRTAACPALRYGHSIRLKSVTARLCRGQAVEILDTRGALVPGACTIGDFLTYQPPG
jgi:hypothetical protein